MSIKFPKLHIATSVVNRIMNIAAGLEVPETPSDATPRDVPQAQEKTGPAIDAALYQPTQASDASPQTAEAIATSSLL